MYCRRSAPYYRRLSFLGFLTVLVVCLFPTTLMGHGKPAGPAFEPVKKHQPRPYPLPDDRPDVEMRVAVLTGIRYVDGMGDLALNRILIENTAERLRAHYGPTIELNIVFMNEVESDANPLRGLDGVRRVYGDGAFQRALDILTAVDDAGETPISYRDPRTGLRYWLESRFRHFIINNPSSIDLALMASDVAATVINYKFRVPLWLAQHTHVISFAEYNSMSNVLHVDLHHNRNSDAVFMSARLASGVGSGAGVLFSDRLRPAPVATIMEAIGSSLRQGQSGFRRLYAESTFDLSRLASGPWIVPSWLSDGHKVDSQSFAMSSLLMAYFHAQSNPGTFERGYVVVSNKWPDVLSTSDLTELFDNYTVMAHSRGGDFQGLSADQLLAEKEHFLRFVTQHVLILKIGGGALPAPIFDGLFAPENNAILVQMGGYAGLGSMLAAGRMPLFRPREYHREFAQKLLDQLDVYVAPQSGSALRSSVSDVFDLVDSNRFPGRLRQFVQQYVALAPALETAVARLRQESSMMPFVEDVVGVFYASKRRGYRSPLFHLVNHIEWWSRIGGPPDNANRFVRLLHSDPTARAQRAVEAACSILLEGGTLGEEFF